MLRFELITVRSTVDEVVEHLQIDLDEFWRFNLAARSPLVITVDAHLRCLLLPVLSS